ncbi:MAG: type II secretion system F family protein [Candidatus Humimicrobiaceae bacterium]
MAVFDYKARDKNGEIIDGSLEAANEDVLVGVLKDQGLFVFDIKKSKEGKTKSKGTSFSFLNRIKNRDLSVFTRQFATLITSGMSLIESLVVLERQTANPKFVEVITTVRRDIESGHSLSEAMGKHKIFTRLYISLIRAGETGGVLDESMENLADFLEKDEEIRLQIRNKTAYPKFVLAFAVIITLVIIIFLVPTFKEIYDDLGVQLPLMTRIVVRVGDLFKTIYFYIIAVVLIVGGRYLFKKFRETPRGRYIVDNIRISVPKMGAVIKKMALARFARYLGTLLGAGVPVLSALDIVKSVTDNVLIDDAIGEIKNNIRRGENISGPMAKNNIFPPMMVQMTAVGEKTGTLDANLIRISDFYDAEVASTIEILLAILEPIMLLIVALLVGTIVIAMYLPLFNIYQAM